MIDDISDILAWLKGFRAGCAVNDWRLHDVAILIAAAERIRESIASGIEAPSGVETVQQGSTEGESPAPAGGDAQ